MSSHRHEWSPLALAYAVETFDLKGAMGLQKRPFESSGRLLW